MAELTSLTRRQREILDFINRKIESRGFPPTIRDIGTAFEIRSPNGVMCHLKALEKKGFISRQGKSARAIQISHRTVPTTSIPFKGLVAAGTPLAAEEQEERLDLTELFPGADIYALRVQGTSMIDEHIQDGDIVIIRNQESAQNGDRVVAQIDGEVTLKVFQRMKDEIHLIPANREMTPIVVTPDRDIRILGVLNGVIRKC
ncbi:MAG: transcriptional repressor LexA [Gemmataceae bacterium]|nr:transcriptional repressor LexA [Gemmataceae bacterium]